jgi:hypothetical protein
METHLITFCPEWPTWKGTSGHLVSNQLSNFLFFRLRGIPTDWYNWNCHYSHQSTAKALGPNTSVTQTYWTPCVLMPMLFYSNGWSCFQWKNVKFVSLFIGADRLSDWF